MSTTARVAQVWLFPVKSMSGAAVPTAEVTAGGLAGDRAWAVVDEAGATVTAKQEPRLRAAVARLVDGVLTVDVPGHGRVAQPAVGEALSAWLGRRVRLDHRGAAGFVDVAPVHLVSTQSLADAEHAEQCDACDVREPRANLVLDLADGADPEVDWVGRRLTAGGAELSVTCRPSHCLGVYAEVTVPGAIAVGDEVRPA